MDLDNINSTLIQPIIDGLFYIVMDEYGEVEINYMISKIFKQNFKVKIPLSSQMRQSIINYLPMPIFLTISSFNNIIIN